MSRINIYIRLMWLGLGFGFLLCGQSIAEDFHTYVVYMTTGLGDIMP